MKGESEVGGESKYLELIREEVKNKISSSHSGVEEQLRED